MNILIVGYGIVGHNLAKEISILKPDVYDKYKTTENTKRDIKYDICFICVDTPYSENNPCDVSEVKNAIMENDSDIYIIKSTVLVGTTEQIAKETGKNIIFSPEYYGGTQHCNNYSFDFTIFGGEKKNCQKVIQSLQKVYDGRHKFVMTDSKTAELCKYMENSFLATKVSFCVAFWEICKRYGVSYEELRELFVLDPRVNESHTFVYEDKPYWDSHCLNKDVPAIAETANSSFLNQIIKYNENMKKLFEKY